MRNIKIITNIDPFIPEEIISDPRRVKQILVNLICNALKFTFKGYIKITANSYIIKSKNCIQIIVEDTGIGIKQKDLCKLFKVFSMIESSKELNQGGTGLGLKISMQFSKLLTYPGGKGL